MQINDDLTAQVDKFQRWLESNSRKDTLNPEFYSGWPTLKVALLGFLQGKLSGNWTSVDEGLVGRFCRLDWHSRKLFCDISDQERLRIMVSPYSDCGVRMYMLICARQYKSITMEVAQHYFTSDISEAIREEALVTLSRCSWPEAEDHAIRLWKTRKTVKRMVALDCLKALDSPRLDEYLQKGIASRDSAVSRHAQAIQCTKGIK